MLDLKGIFRKGYVLFKTLLPVSAAALLLSSCGSGGTDSGNGHVSLADYNVLYDYNAYRLDGRTIRWASTTIPVFGATGNGWQAAISRWPTVEFQFVNAKPAVGIQISGYDDLGSACGLSSFSYDGAGVMESCTIEISNRHEALGCGSEADTVSHEVGHCIGIFKHTRDGGLMDDTAQNSRTITAPVKTMIGLLYALPPGTDISADVTVLRSGI